MAGGSVGLGGCLSHGRWRQIVRVARARSSPDLQPQSSVGVRATTTLILDPCLLADIHSAVRPTQTPASALTQLSPSHRRFLAAPDPIRGRTLPLAQRDQATHNHHAGLPVHPAPIRYICSHHRCSSPPSQPPCAQLAPSQPGRDLGQLRSQPDICFWRRARPPLCSVMIHSRICLEVGRAERVQGRWRRRGQGRRHATSNGLSREF